MEVATERSSVVTIPEWAADFKMSATTAWGIVRRGEIEVIRYGRSVRITREAVEAWKARSQGRWPDLAG